MSKFEEGKIYISRTDHLDRIWLWKCCETGNNQYYNHRLLIYKNGNVEYDYLMFKKEHGWSNNILATPVEANWLEQCILNPKIINISEISKLALIDYEIMKYKISDKVWIREDLNGKDSYGGEAWKYKITGEETDIRGKLITITGWRSSKKNSYKCSEYSGIVDEMIDHEKTARGVYQEPQYEIY